jgi:hypothetical protein
MADGIETVKELGDGGHRIFSNSLMRQYPRRDSAVWAQEKPEARKMLENAAESHPSHILLVRFLP